MSVKNTIKYFGYYDSQLNEQEDRSFSPAAKNKMDYICHVLNRCGYDVCIVSPCITRKSQVLLGKKLKLDEQNSLRLFMTLGRGSRLRHALDYLLHYLLLFIYVMRHVKKDELILVYHSLGFRNLINFAKRIRGFKVILEVEEIYQDAVDCSSRMQCFEYKSFNNADAFIFPSALLNTLVNKNNLPYLLIHGAYSVSDISIQHCPRQLIHVVYSGTFDLRKGGALAAINAGLFLPDIYHVHILGFGSDQDVENIIEMIANVNDRSSAKITYDGLLPEHEFKEFLHTCHIGLSTQNPDIALSDTCYPSKILLYMAHGLQVVSARIKVVETSAIGQYVEFYDENSPQDIAKAIIRLGLNQKVDGRAILNKLDKELVVEMPAFLKKSC